MTYDQWLHNAAEKHMESGLAGGSGVVTFAIERDPNPASGLAARYMVEVEIYHGEAGHLGEIIDREGPDGMQECHTAVHLTPDERRQAEELWAELRFFDDDWGDA